MEGNIFSILPPIVAIILAIVTRQALFSLLLGLYMGSIILSDGNLFTSILGTLDIIVGVFESESSTQTLIFTLLIGALIQIIKYVGGVEGFTQRISRFFSQSKHPKIKMQLGAFLTGTLVFIESNISIITVGTVFKPLFDKYKISREKLAFLADSSSAPVCILVPFNAWGAFIIGILATYPAINPLEALIFSIPLNFYALTTLTLVLVTLIFDKYFGPIRKTRPTKSEFTDKVTTKSSYLDMLLPILFMVFSMPLFLIYTGWTASESDSFTQRIWEAINHSSGSKAVLYAISSSLLFSGILFGFKRKLKLPTFFSESLKGMTTMMEMSVLILLAFAIGNLCRDLQTGLYIANATEGWLYPALAPAIIFIISAVIAFSTGTSWGTFAIMLSIVIPLTESMHLPEYIMISAVLGGGIFGDHCSPISDTTLIASAASGCDHIAHVKTQLPYALLSGIISIILYVLFGFLLVG